MPKISAKPYRFIDFKISSEYLKREVQCRIFLNEKHNQDLKSDLLLLNDGQDQDALNLEKTLNNYQDNLGQLVVVTINANNDRINEYGTAKQPDYMNRGNKADLYQDFIVKELLPWIYENQLPKTQVKQTVFAGFSLGGLSAMDIAWNNQQIFDKVGVFSGSFWWRSKAFQEGFDEENDRIMHQNIKKGRYQNNQSYWFEAGTEDETSDRNNNGVIDSIDDTLDIIKELKKKNVESTKISYHEINGGKHNFETWSKAFPVFLEWAFRKP